MWIEDNELAPPPRPVSLGATLEVLLGGLLVQIGCGVFAFGSIFGWIFASRADLTPWTRFSGEVETAQGTVLDLVRTGVSVNDTPITGTRYRFVGPDGVERTATSYVTGGGPAVGAAVTIEFPAGDPDCSRVTGQTCGMLGPAALLALIFPAVGLVPVLIGLRGGLRRVRLLRHGRRAEATFSGRQPTNMTVNDQPVWEMVFTFKDDRGEERTVSSKTHDTTALEDEPSERVLYDDEQAVLVDSLPGRGQSTTLGGWEAASMVGPVAKLLLPGLAVGINALGWSLRFGS